MESITEKLPDISARDLLGKSSYHLGVARRLLEVFEVQEGLRDHIIAANALMEAVMEVLK